MTTERSRSTVRTGRAGAYALPAGAAALLMIGAAAASVRVGHGATWLIAAVTAVVLGTGLLAEPAGGLLVTAAGWLAVQAFSGPPYGRVRLIWPGDVRSAVVVGGAGLAGMALGYLVRHRPGPVTLVGMGVTDDPGRARRDRPGLPMLGGLDHRRQLTGVLLVAVLPLLTAVLLGGRGFLSLYDDLLVFLVFVVVVAVIGGFWPAVLAAITASMLLNWYFTPPLHTFTIADPQNMLALLLFITVAVVVSSVVHLAALRAVQAARSAADAAALLALAQTVLGGSDTPAAILDHLTALHGGSAELSERVAGRWARVAASGTVPAGGPVTRVQVRPDLALVVTGQPEPMTSRLLDGFAAQAAAALDRDRLRIQAAQAEALAAGNRMRTALLAAVSHDLRTPLASIKVSVSTLRQTGVALTPADEAALLSTVEESADRLNALIGNLLDMSRLTAGSLEPFLRPVSIDEVAPLALPGADAGITVRLVMPDDLPLVRTDPGLLERVLANLFANAIAHSPPGRPPVMTARAAGPVVVLDITDFGPGVPDGLKERIFQPFERLGERNTGTGVGLGLAVARGFTEAMGGSLTALDTSGGGLTMRIRLPAAVTGHALAAGS
ncbi:MAG: sensor histidine kinase [Streptosporangiaceae bacterium]